MSPTLLELPVIHLTGLQIHTRPMSPEIPALWPRFMARVSEIRQPLRPDVSFGVMQNLAADMTSLEYMAAVETNANEPLPSGMERLALPAGIYAVFKVPFRDLPAGYDAIFNGWLPSAPYVQRPGPYYERYDEAFDPDRPESVVEIVVPVDPKA